MLKWNAINLEQIGEVWCISPKHMTAMEAISLYDSGYLLAREAALLPPGVFAALVRYIKGAVSRRRVEVT